MVELLGKINTHLAQGVQPKTPMQVRTPCIALMRCQYTCGCWMMLILQSTSNPGAPGADPAGAARAGHQV
jgi:hypothetical protein